MIIYKVHRTYLDLTDREVIIRKAIDDTAMDRLKVRKNMNKYRKTDLKIQSKKAVEDSANNIIILPHRTMIVNQINDLRTTKPAIFSIDDLKVPYDDATKDVFQDFFIKNTFNLIRHKYCEDMGASGVGNVVLWFNDEGDVAVKVLQPDSVICVVDHYDNIFAYIHIYNSIDENNKDVLYADWYSSSHRYYYVGSDEGVFEPTFYNGVHEYNHGFSYFPVIQIFNNEYGDPDYHLAEECIDSIDLLHSLMMDEVENIRSHYLKMILPEGMTIEEYFDELQNAFGGPDNDGMVPVTKIIDVLKKLREKNMWVMQHGGDLAYITRNINDKLVADERKHLRDAIYTFSGTIDILDDMFKNSESGVARLWKMLFLELVAGRKDMQESLFLRQMFKVLCSGLDNKYNISIDYTDIYWDLPRNIPADIIMLSQVVDKLWGKISKKTLRTIVGRILNIDDLEWEEDVIKQEQLEEKNIAEIIEK